MTRPTPDPCAVVIFGASGDLTQRKLLPALYNLHARGLMPHETSVIGTSRTQYSEEDFRADMRTAVDEHSRIERDDGAWESFSRDLYYEPGDINDLELFKRLGRRLEEIDRQQGTKGNRVWYMATLPSLFSLIAEQLAKAGSCDTGGWNRLVVEKPFGKDLASAKELNGILTDRFSEDQIFRIDHYLGKETVQNLLVFRFANAIFEPVWNRRYIDNIQITAAEDIGVDGRGAFYDRTGALRDVGQNHLLQLLSLIAMEPPVAWDETAIRNEKVQVLKALRRWTEDDCATVVTRGQYEGYLDEKNVEGDSRTETFFAAKLHVDSWRWADVPFYIRAGKCLPTKATQIDIEFDRVPHLLFEKTAVEELERNQLVIRIQPNEGFSLKFGIKTPGPEVNVQTVDMDFDYETDFPSGTPEAYERLLLDCMLGDPTLFTRSDEIEEAWEIVDPILKYWRNGRPRKYRPGTWGPAVADELLWRDGRRWKQPG